MNKKLSILTVIVLGTLMAVNIPVALAEKCARRLAVRAGADRVVELQRTDSDWDGTWYWYVGSNNDATNVTGVTALGLLEAFRDVRDPAYKEASKNAANFILEHLGLSRTPAESTITIHRAMSAHATSTFSSLSLVKNIRHISVQ